MIKVYTGRMVPTTQPGRPVYERIIGAPIDDRCPLCGVGIVTTLDHHLPKSEYPVLSVVPTNLVPCCSWCQGAKREAFPDQSENQTLHPYYDNVEAAVWLQADVVVGVPATFKFRVAPPQNWSALIRRRLERHLEVFDLQRLFVSNAASHLSEIRHSLNYLHQTSGSVAVREHLEREALSREAVHRNSWAAAMYRAAFSSDWFCDGGFAQT